MSFFLRHIDSQLHDPADRSSAPAFALQLSASPSFPTLTLAPSSGAHLSSSCSTSPLRDALLTRRLVETRTGGTEAGVVADRRARRRIRSDVSSDEVLLLLSGSERYVPPQLPDSLFTTRRALSKLKTPPPASDLRRRSTTLFPHRARWSFACSTGANESVTSAKLSQ